MQTVCLWRKRIAQQGAQGIREGERSGCPPRVTHEARLQLIALACETQEPEGRVTPTLDEIAARAVERGVVEQISRSHVQRILQAGDVRPHRVQQWLHSPDPAFREKVNGICKLYRKAPRNAAVLSIDEKTGIQAIVAQAPRDVRPRPDGFAVVSLNICLVSKMCGCLAARGDCQVHDTARFLSL